MDRQANELLTLKVIAETLNVSNDMEKMLQLVLEKLLEVTGLEVGWIFLAGDEPHYDFIADVNLPPALVRDGKEPMCTGVCYCLSKYWAGELNQAVNIINCKRLGDAIRFKRGDTAGITHHATVPLGAGGELFGVLNVASPYKQVFSNDELNLLQSVAFQIGTAIKRMKLYEEQKRRAKTLAKVDVVSRSIWEVKDIDSFPCHIVESIASAFQFKRILFLLDQGQRYQISSDYRDGRVFCDIEQEPADWNPVDKPGFQKGRFPFDQEIRSYYWLPIKTGNERIGGLAILHDDIFQDIYLGGLIALSDHVALGWENLQLNEKRRELNLIEERNRLARDLHDAVSQKLFSLSLTSNGARAIAGKNPEALNEALKDIQKLSKEALAEMRAMIFQLRPIPKERMLSQEIVAYAKRLGVNVSVQSRGEAFIPEIYRENLWRVLQETMNNISKHAKTAEAAVKINANDRQITLQVLDHGVGFNVEEKQGEQKTLGLSSMCERIEQMGGTILIDSQVGKGTTVSVNLPLGRLKGEGET